MAASRTVRAIGPSVESPSSQSVYGTRPIDGLIPTAPHSEEGTRIEPPPSDPQAIGPTPATTASSEVIARCCPLIRARVLVSSESKTGTCIAWVSGTWAAVASSCCWAREPVSWLRSSCTWADRTPERQ